jgi:hypothetical protein
MEAARITLGRFMPGSRAPTTHWTRGLVGFGSGMNSSQKKIKSVAPFQDPTPNSSDVQHTAYWLNRLFCIALFRIPSIIFILTEINRRHFFSQFAKADNQRVEMPHRIKQITYKHFTRVEKPRQIKQIKNKNVTRVKELTRLKISHKNSRE